MSDAYLPALPLHPCRRRYQDWCLMMLYLRHRLSWPRYAWMPECVSVSVSLLFHCQDLHAAWPFHLIQVGIKEVITSSWHVLTVFLEYRAILIAHFFVWRCRKCERPTLRAMSQPYLHNQSSWLSWSCRRQTLLAWVPCRRRQSSWGYQDPGLQYRG